MAKTATLSTTVTVTGDAMVAGTFTPTNIAANINAPPPTLQQLSAGNNTVTVPTGFTVNGCMVIPPSGSSNSKTYRGIAGDTGFTGTSQQVLVPLTSMANFVINSTGSETVQLVWV